MTILYCLIFVWFHLNLENEEIRRELALSQLLQLIELPVVEGIICDTATNGANKEQMAFNNLAFRQHDSILSELSAGRYGNQKKQQFYFVKTSLFCMSGEKKSQICIRTLVVCHRRIPSIMCTVL